MSIEKQIKTYIDSQSGSKRADLQSLHIMILDLMPKTQLWFLDGKDATGKTIANPNIGYGLQMINYADGSFKEFYQIGISANTKGISVYIIGIKDKEYLAKTFLAIIGKATITGYCIKFKTIKDINISLLKSAIQYGINQTSVDLVLKCLL
ncbi:DUF1801 domain-containing protein [Paenimyroides baculatum]|uniref:DUF1801 domain-containing protein n=1 Tax=Paenimyroides baculatum TaxID=2608000 RepID=A0A5M6CLQ0_9FLAO|nr:DUF1801 domain-containing protein [Paenimyroides baculatum]KAA5534245.1 DUF1801 domain-containing protein [Paenimyroides baculatum]